MGKLKFILTKFENTLLFQILEQHDTPMPTSFSKRYIQFVEDKFKNKWVICIASNPFISYCDEEGYDYYSFTVDGNTYDYYRTIFIRGISKTGDNKIVKLTFSCNSERDYYYEAIIDVLEKVFKEPNFIETIDE